MVCRKLQEVKKQWVPKKVPSTTETTDTAEWQQVTKEKSRPTETIQTDAPRVIEVIDKEASSMTASEGKRRREKLIDKGISHE